MIGGLKKTVSRLAIVAAAGAMSSTAAMAADLGGNCCSDLEERVAELEATTARKGNRRVSLTVSGHVHEAIFFFDVDGNQDPGLRAENLVESNTYIGTHNSSRSRFRFRGSANINADWSAGFYMEFGVRRNALNATDQTNPRVTSGIDIRHEALYVKSKRIGTFWLGWTGSAIEGITEICLGCTLGNASPDPSFLVNNLIAPGNNVRFRNHASASGFFAGEGDRRNMLKYISPTFAGFAFSASWGGDDFWDVALRYAAEWGDFRVGAGVGYSQDTNGVGNSEGVSAIGCVGNNGVDDRDCTTLGASASIQHVPTGIYTRFSYGQNVNEATTSPNDQDDGWEVTVGLNRKWIALGKTGIWAVYGVSEREIGLAAGTDSELEMWGLGVDQKIDAAAMEMYLWYRHYEAEAAGVDVGEADVVLFGTRIKF